MKVKENLEHILKELQDATFKIEEEQIENVLKLIAPDKKIFLTGKGRSGLAAKFSFQAVCTISEPFFYNASFR